MKVRARYAWPAGLGAWAAAWYASESLRHRREHGHGYQLRGERLAVGAGEFLRAAEALTSAPISEGNDVELLINGDRIFPAFLETIAAARRTVNLLTYVYWRGDIAGEVAGLLARRAREGVEVNVLLDWVGSAKMDSGLIDDMRDAGVCVSRQCSGSWASPVHSSAMPTPPVIPTRPSATSSLRCVRLFSRRMA